MSYSELLDQLIALALERHREKSESETTINVNTVSYTHLDVYKRQTLD